MPVLEAVDCAEKKREDAFRRSLKQAVDAASTFRSGIPFSEIIRLAIEDLRSPRSKPQVVHSPRI